MEREARNWVVNKLCIHQSSSYSFISVFCSSTQSLSCRWSTNSVIGGGTFRGFTQCVCYRKCINDTKKQRGEDHHTDIRRYLYGTIPATRWVSKWLKPISNILKRISQPIHKETTKNGHTVLAPARDGDLFVQWETKKSLFLLSILPVFLISKRFWDPKIPLVSWKSHRQERYSTNGILVSWAQRIIKSKIFSTVHVSPKSLYTRIFDFINELSTEESTRLPRNVRTGSRKKQSAVGSESNDSSYREKSKRDHHYKQTLDISKGEKIGKMNKSSFRLEN